MEQEEEAQRHDTRGGGSGRGLHSIRLLLLPSSGLSRVGFFSLPPSSFRRRAIFVQARALNKTGRRRRGEKPGGREG